MTTDTSNADAADSGRDARLSPSTIFELLLEDNRRYALYSLSRTVGAVGLDELIDEIADREGDRTGERIAQITAEFHHNHLRKLVDSKVLRYDADAGTVERRAAAGSLDPYLELASVDDL